VGGGRWAECKPSCRNRDHAATCRAYQSPPLRRRAEHKPIIFQPQLPLSGFLSLRQLYSCFCQLHSSDDNSVSSVCPNLVVCRYVGQLAGLTCRGLTAPVTADRSGGGDGSGGGGGGGGDGAESRIRDRMRCKEPSQKSL